jgi:predicted  nucleic acid-binding Zn-ribbon protein
MDGSELTVRVAAAEAELELARARLRDTEARAGAGASVENPERERLAAAYQKAERQARSARQALKKWQEALQAAPESAPPRIDPTPGLLFARWLYQNGYIFG